MTVDQGRVRWGDVWLQAVGAGSSWLERGRHGRRSVDGLQVEPGRITARVRDGRSRPHRVTITVPTLDREAWDAVVAALADELRFTARLLEGELPTDITDVAAGVGVQLVPSSDEIESSCTCGGRRCRHLAAVHHAVAAALDVEPFGLLRLRGRDRDQLLVSLRATRSRAPAADAPAAPGELRLEDLAGVDLFAARGDIDAVRLHPVRAEEPGALLLRLGDPPGVDDPVAIEAIMARAVDTAWKLAAGAGTQAADEEVLLAELRAQRTGTAASVAEGIGWDTERTREELDRLFEEGTVMRTGKGDRTKYRA